MQANRKDPNPGVFFPWPDNKKGDEKSGITVRQLNVRMRREIDDKTLVEEVKYLDGHVYERKVVKDPDLRAHLINDYCIVGWNGLLDEDGKEIECTTANKVWLMTECPGVAAFVVEFMIKLDEILFRRAEIERKN